MSESPADFPPVEKRRKGRRRFALLLFLLFFAGTLYLGLRVEPLRISERTTRYVKPLLPGGLRVDYFRIWEEQAYPPEMKTDDNGYRLFVKSCGEQVRRSSDEIDPMTRHVPADPLPHQLQVYEKLGLHPDEAGSIRLESPSSYLERKKKEHPADKNFPEWYTNWITRRAPTTLKNHPFLEDWLAENEAGIDRLAEAARKPVFQIPAVRLDEGNRSLYYMFFAQENILFREFVRSVLARAEYRISLGNLDGAIDDIVAAQHLARHLGYQEHRNSATIGHALERAAVSVRLDANPDCPPTRKHWGRLAEEREKLPPRKAFVDFYESERLFNLALFQDIYWNSWQPQRDFPIPSNMNRYYDFNVIFEELNAMFDRFAAGSIPVEPAHSPFFFTATQRSNSFIAQWIHDFKRVDEQQRRQWEDRVREIENRIRADEKRAEEASEPETP